MNEHWQIVSAGGIVISSTAQGLWEQAANYFKWCDEHPIKAYKTMQSGKTQGQKVEVNYTRPYTIDALCLHCGISKRFLLDIQGMYGKESDWYHVVDKILSIIYTQNLEGALVELFNPIIITKLLNLEKPEDKDGMAVKVEIVDTRKNKLANNENDILANLDFNVVNDFKQKFGKEDSE